MTEPKDMPTQQDMTALARTPPAVRRVEIACSLAFPVTAVALFCRLWEPMKACWALSGLALVAGFVAADLVSGAGHWFFDTWFSPDTPIIGRSLVRTFREHHVDPDAICRHDFIETNGSNLLGGSFLMVCGLCTDTGSVLGAFDAAALFSSGVFVAITSQIHKWAHAAEVPPPVAWLQRTGIILSKDAHALHHRAPFDTAYCITSGWLNATLQRLDVFGLLERAVAAVTGARPRGGQSSEP